MNDEKQVLKLAAERLPEDVRAFIESATLHLQSSASKTQDQHAAMFRVAYALYVKYDVEGRSIRPPAVAPEPKPSRAVLDACKRQMMEPWKLARFVSGDTILTPGCVDDSVGSTYDYDAFAWKATADQSPSVDALYWHVRPIAATLPCPPKPTPDQVAAARMPDGRRVKEPTVCEVPNGRAWFADSSPRVYAGSKVPASEYGQRRWIAEPADAVVEPWTRETCPVGSVVVDTDGARCQIAEACDEVMKYGGHRQCTYDWALHNLKTHDGQPCGVAK